MYPLINKITATFPFQVPEVKIYPVIHLLYLPVDINEDSFDSFCFFKGMVYVY